MTEEVFENWVKLLNLSKNFTTFKLKNFNDEINNFFQEMFLQSNSELREAHLKSQWNGRIEEVSEFHFRHLQVED